MLNYAESFGLIIFVYALGLQVGPGFFGSLRRGGMNLNLLALSVILIGTSLALLFHAITNVSLPDMVGILSGAVTNTPALGAAQQTIKQMNISASDPALGCAVTYPLGVVGVILAIIVLRKLFPLRTQYIHREDGSKQTYIAAFEVLNPGIFNKNLKQVAQLGAHRLLPLDYGAMAMYQSLFQIQFYKKEIAYLLLPHVLTKKLSKHYSEQKNLQTGIVGILIGTP